MARNPSIPPSTDGKPARRRRAFVLLPLVLAVSGCEAMERMDCWDRYFELAARPGPVIAAEPMPDPVPPPATDWSPQPGTVIAMEPRPNPVPSPATDRPSRSAGVRATEPRPSSVASPAETDAESRTRSLVRQHHWLTQFWMELTPAQQQRVERQLHRGNVRLAGERTDPAAAWDSLGLADRARLVFGSGTPFERPAPAERRDGSVWAGNS